jgi:hypothetical protein
MTCLGWQSPAHSPTSNLSFPPSPGSTQPPAHDQRVSCVKHLQISSLECKGSPRFSGMTLLTHLWPHTIFGEEGALAGNAIPCPPSTSLASRGRAPPLPQHSNCWAAQSGCSWALQAAWFADELAEGHPHLGWRAFVGYPPYKLSKKAPALLFLPLWTEADGNTRAGPSASSLASLLGSSGVLGPQPLAGPPNGLASPAQTLTRQAGTP